LWLATQEMKIVLHSVVGNIGQIVTFGKLCCNLLYDAWRQARAEEALLLLLLLLLLHAAEDTGSQSFPAPTISKPNSCSS
jgi:hypothetical protein